MKNTLTDLNNHLFSALERLNDEGLSPENLEAEIQRSRAIVTVGKITVENARLVLDAARHIEDVRQNTGSTAEALPEIFAEKRLPAPARKK